MSQEEAVAFARFRMAGQPKTFFNYLLLSPCKPVQDFRGFAEAVFYIGKGKNSRSFQHLREAGANSGKVGDIYNGPATYPTAPKSQATCSLSTTDIPEKGQDSGDMASRKRCLVPARFQQYVSQRGILSRSSHDRLRRLAPTSSVLTESTT